MGQNIFKKYLKWKKHPKLGKFAYHFFHSSIFDKLWMDFFLWLNTFWHNQYLAMASNFKMSHWEGLCEEK